ncbi:MAG TPA: ribbon-helix-helix domain-containing protein [Terriglobales bacterium]|jgi:CopG family transcriptional regulator/antitoxin EndoAI|nr:ribbon-helix-helix domain-containing protein [Terriglobales bacterium]
MHKRINITLPEDTIRMIDRVARNGGRSRLIDQAVRRYVAEVGRENLRAKLKEGAIRRAERDLEIAGEWLPLEQEAWKKARR